MGRRRSESRSAGGGGLPDAPSSLFLAILGAQPGLLQGEGVKPSAAKVFFKPHTRTFMHKLTNVTRGHREHSRVCREKKEKTFPRWERSCC